MTESFVNWGLSCNTLTEKGWYLDVIPFFTTHWVNTITHNDRKRIVRIDDIVINTQNVTTSEEIPIKDSL